MSAVELHQLRYACAIAEAGSFTRAAARLYLAQPSLSVQIRKLERELATQLFERRGRRVAPTAAGAVFLDHARRALAELDLAREGIRQLAETPPGQVRLGVPPSVACAIVPDMLARLHGEHPEVAAAIVERDSSEQLVEMVTAGEVDLAVVRAQVSTPDLARVPLLREPLAALLPVGHRLATAERTSLRELAQETFVGLPSGNALRELMEHACGRVGFAPHVAVEANQLASVWGMVRAGLGVAVLPRSAVGAATGVRAVTIEERFLHRDLVMVWRRAQRLPAPAETVLALLLSVACPAACHPTD